MSTEYVRTEFNCQRISVIFHSSASDKLAIDLLILLVCVVFPQRERKSVWQIVSNKRFVNDTRVWQTLQVFIYTYSVTHTL